MGVLLIPLMMGAEVFALSGTVKDQEGAAIAGALVSLVSDTTIRETTNSNGEFNIDKAVSIADRELARLEGRSDAKLGMWGGRVRITIASPARSGAVAVFGNDGKKRLEIPLGPLESGSHPIDLPGLAPGIYLLRAAVDGHSAAARLLQSGHGAFLSPEAPGAREISPLLRAAASPAAVDTLLVKKSGYATVKSPVASYAQTGIAIVMDPAPDTGSPLPPITDYSALGPFSTVVEANVGPGGNYTIFRPDPLGKDGFLHAPIIYGHGIGGQVSGAANFLRNIASHGFVIIGCNVLNGGPNSPANNTAMTNGLNWILQQNGAAGSKYQGKLAVDRASSMGYSVGGTAAVDIGGHEAIKTVVSIHGHISTATLRGTLLQTSGTRDNVGLPMQQQTFANSKVQTFLGTVTNADHGYISRDNGGVQRPAIVAWLRYWIYNDTGARHYFYGDDCVMCKAPWENPQRKNWK
jgi:dienelactone hydrolase